VLGADEAPAKPRRSAKRRRSAWQLVRPLLACRSLREGATRSAAFGVPVTSGGVRGRGATHWRLSRQEAQFTWERSCSGLIGISTRECAAWTSLVAASLYEESAPATHRDQGVAMRIARPLAKFSPQKIVGSKPCPRDWDNHMGGHRRVTPAPLWLTTWAHPLHRSGKERRRLHSVTWLQTST
jgi:hypothetical protein